MYVVPPIPLIIGAPTPITPPTGTTLPTPTLPTATPPTATPPTGTTVLTLPTPTTPPTYIPPIPPSQMHYNLVAFTRESSPTTAMTT